ncbi:MAG: sulfatase [Verrucomicrobiales bacterium]|nr:sulfatase [Verrucomicrobiales bacterium]
MLRHVFTCLSLLFLAAASHGEQRPNIVFAFADDWGRYASAYAATDGPATANSVIRTPHIDRVAARGVLFRNAHVTAPSCTPCRSSLLSGQYFFRTGRGAILSGAVWDASIPSYPLLLRDAGYHIGETYKVWSPGIPVDAPYGAGQYGYEKAGGEYNAFSQNATRLIAEGKTRDEAKAYLLNQVRGNFGAFLDDRKGDQPFCYWFGPTNVHRKWTRGSGKALWDLNPEDLKGKMPPFLPDVPEVREDFADYLGEAMAFDAGVGVLLEMLEQRGLMDNTVVVISGDHGAPGFPYGKCNLYDFGTNVSLIAAGPNIPGGRVVEDFVNLMDLAPTYLELGGLTPPAVMTGRSLVPVLHSDQQGQVDPERTWVVTGRERHVATARDGGLPYPQRSIRTPTHRLIINFKPDRYPMGNPYNLDGKVTPPTQEALTEDTYATYPDMDSSPTKAWLVGQRDNPAWKHHYELAFGLRPRLELYDLAKDPFQIHNVAGDPAYAAVEKELESRLLTVLTDARDPRVLGDGETFEHEPYAGPIPPDALPPRKGGKGKKKGKK